jgi:hypothetical protein
MRKIALFLCATISTAAFSQESICASNFEVVGMNADFGKSSIKVLQGGMETKMNSRQLVIPSAENTIATTDSEDSQIAWAKRSGCSYLLQTTLTRLGETVQVSARLMELSSKGYAFKRAYKANSPDDLHPIFQQIGNALQDPKFTAIETIYDVTNADAKSLTKKRSSTYWGLSVGAAYYKDIEEIYNIGLGFMWDSRIILGEIVYDIGFGGDGNASLNHFGFRVLYPFSDRNNTMYLGCGAGLAFSSWEKEEKITRYDSDWENSETYISTRTIENSGLLLEASVGYLIGRTSDLIFRVEAYGDFLFDSKSMGGGARFVLGID